EQADGTAWMALYCQNMLEIATELAMTDPDYEDMALKFIQHFYWIASSMSHLGQDTGMWDEEDGFFYDVLLACAPRIGPLEMGVPRYTVPWRDPCGSDGPPTKCCDCSEISTATWPRASASPTSAARPASPRRPITAGDSNMTPRR